MDDPFAMAADDLANSELGTTVTYRFKEGGPPKRGVRVIFTEEEVEVDGANPAGPGALVIRTEAIVTAAALAPGRPQAGDTLGVGTESGWRVGSVRQDARKVRFFLGLGAQ